MRKKWIIDDAGQLVVYIKNLAETAAKKVFAPVDVEMMSRVILRVHNQLLEQIQNIGVSIKKYMNDICTFHLVCIKYFLDYGNTRGLERLVKGCFGHDEIYQYKGCGAYAGIIERQRLYMDRNNMRKIDAVQFLEDLFHNEDVIKNEMAYYAAVDFLWMIINKEVIDRSVNYMLGSEYGKLEQGIFSGYSLIADYLLQLGNRSEKHIRNGIEFISRIMYYTVNMHKSRLDDVFQMEQYFLGMLDQGRERVIRVIEEEILFRSHLLIWYVQRYSLGVRRRAPQNEIDSMRSLITGRLQEIYAARERIREIPVSLAEVFYTAIALAGTVLQIKFRIWKKDFSHISLCNQEIQKKLDGIMEKFEICLNGLEIN